MNVCSLLCAALLLIAPAVAWQSATPTSAEQKPAQLRELQVECTPASHALELVGGHGCVAGRVFRVTVHKSGNTHLSLCPSHKCSFQAVISKRSRGKVGDLSYLRGRIIAVQGDVTESRSGRPVIFVKDREQVRVAAGDPPPDFDAAQSQPRKSAYSVKRNRAW